MSDFSVDASGSARVNTGIKFFPFNFDKEQSLVVKIAVDKTTVAIGASLTINELLKAVIVCYTDNDKTIVWGKDTQGTVDNDTISVLPVNIDSDMAKSVPLGGLQLQVVAKRVEIYLSSPQVSIAIAGTVEVSKGEISPFVSNANFKLEQDATLGGNNCNAYVDIPFGAKQFSLLMDNNDTDQTDNPTPQGVYQISAGSSPFLYTVVNSDVQRFDIQPDAIGLRITPLEVDSRNLNARGRVVFFGDAQYIETDSTVRSDRSTVAAIVGSDVVIPSSINRKWCAIRNPDATNSLYVSYSAAPTAALARFILLAGESFGTSHKGPIYIRTSAGAITVPYESDY
jgi:hypothetical protein